MAAPDWLHVKEPRDVRPVCDFILAELKVVNSEVAQLMEAPGDHPQPQGGAASQRGNAPGAGAGRGGAQGGAMVGGGNSKAIARNVAKLFQARG